MTDLTKASEARERLLERIRHGSYWVEEYFGVDGDAEVAGGLRDLDAYAEAVRADTLADVAARLPEALANAVHRADHGQLCPAWTGPKSIPWEVCDCWVKPREQTRTTAILAHLTGGTDR